MQKILLFSLKNCIPVSEKINLKSSLQTDIQMVRKKLWEKIGPPTKPKQEVFYDPGELKQLCEEAGAPSIFQFLYESISQPHHSIEREKENEKRTVALIYTLYYCQSQKCFQRKMQSI